MSLHGCIPAWYHRYMKNICAKPVKPRYSFHPPDIRPHLRCDFRIDFDAGMTLKQIGNKYHCDQRTVRACILRNKSSTELGRQFAPTKLQPYFDEIDRLYQQSLRYCHEQERSSSCPDGSLADKPEESSSCPVGSLPGTSEDVPDLTKPDGDVPSIMQLSRDITAAISAKGYTGSERTVRNYLRTHYSAYIHQTGK